MQRGDPSVVLSPPPSSGRVNDQSRSPSRIAGKTMQQRQRNEMKIAHCTRERRRGNCSVINRRGRRKSTPILMNRLLTIERIAERGFLPLSLGTEGNRDRGRLPSKAKCWSWRMLRLPYSLFLDVRKMNSRGSTSKSDGCCALQVHAMADTGMGSRCHCCLKALTNARG